VVILLDLCHQQPEQIQALRDDIAGLKGGSPKAPIKSSKLEGEQHPGKGRNSRGSGRDKNKRSKTQGLAIHDEVVVAPATTPPADLETIRRLIADYPEATRAAPMGNSRT